MIISTQPQMLIPSKCPGATDKAKLTSVSDPSSAQRKQETDTVLRWDLIQKGPSSICIRPLFFMATFCVFRSSSVDTPPLETVASSETLPEDVDIKDMTTDVMEEKVEESPTPAVAQPPHTSPDLSFASEVTSH